MRGECSVVTLEHGMIVNDTDSADIPTPTGPMRTYLFRPAAGGRYPGLVLYSEIFQVTGPIRRAAAMLASHGFVVAVPEIYHELEPAGTVLPYDEAGAERGNRHQNIVELRWRCACRAGLSEILLALHGQAGGYGPVHWRAFSVSCGHAG